MQRLNVYITEKHKRLLEKHNKEGQSISAFIRNIFDDYFLRIESKK